MSELLYLLLMRRKTSKNFLFTSNDFGYDNIWVIDDQSKENTIKVKAKGGAKVVLQSLQAFRLVEE